jgi:hypothetical protein
MSSRIAVPLSMPGKQISRTSRPGRTPIPTAAAASSTGSRTCSSTRSGFAVSRACTTSDKLLSSIHTAGSRTRPATSPGNRTRSSASPGGGVAARSVPASHLSAPWVP